jgi:hypothetical protein
MMSSPDFESMKILHIITKRDELAEKIIEAQRADYSVEVKELGDVNVDYAALLENIFAADSIQIW